jgi:hypothetical protein
MITREIGEGGCPHGARREPRSKGLTDRRATQTDDVGRLQDTPPNFAGGVR